MKSNALIQKTSLLQPGLRVAVDSCVLIHLNRLRVLEMYSELQEIVLTRAIYNEIMSGAEKFKYLEDITLYKKLFAHRLLDVDATSSSTAHPQSSLSIADMSLIQACCTEKLHGIVTDDKSLCVYCRINAIAYLNTPMVLFALLVNKRLMIETFRRKLESVYGMGRYGRFVHAFMDELIREYTQRDNV